MMTFLNLDKNNIVWVGGNCFLGLFHPKTFLARDSVALKKLFFRVPVTFYFFPLVFSQIFFIFQNFLSTFIFFQIFYLKSHTSLLILVFSSRSVALREIFKICQFPQIFEIFHIFDLQDIKVLFLTI